MTSRHIRNQARGNGREQIIEAVLQVIGDHGVEGLTHRRIAGAAGVTIGTITHHFKSLEELLSVAMETLIERDLQELRRQYDAMPAAVDIADVMTSMVISLATAPNNTSILAMELYTAGLRREHLRILAIRWEHRLQEFLERRIGKLSALAVAAAGTGLVQRALITQVPLNKAIVRAVISRALGEETSQVDANRTSRPNPIAAGKPAAVRASKARKT